MTKDEVLGKIIGLYKDHDRFPLISEMSSSLNIPTYRVSQILKALADSGLLIREGNLYRLRPEDIPEHPIPIPELSETTPESLKKDSSVEAIRWIMFLIGVGAAVMSTYYTAIWMMESKPVMVAWSLSGIMVLFSVSAFVTVIAIMVGELRNHWTRWLVAGIFFILWIMVAGFSISSTVAGQYNQHSKIKVTKIESVGVDSLEEKLLNDSIGELISDREDLRSRLAGLITESKKEKPAETMVIIQSRIVATREELEKKRIELDSLREEILRLSKKNVKVLSVSSSKDFYDWLAVDVFKGSNKDMVQFWMSLFPAAFMDIIAPVALAIFLFLRRKESGGTGIDGTG